MLKANETRDKPRLALNNITAGVCERQDANRTREAGHLDEIQGAVASSLVLTRSGAVGFIDWLDRLDRPHDDKESSNSTPDNAARDHIWRVARFRTAFREINHKSKGESIERADDHPVPPSNQLQS